MRALTPPPAGSRAALVLRYGVALATGLAAMLLHVPLHRHFGPSFDPLLLVIVGVSAWYGGLGPGLVTLAVVALGAMLFAPPPAGPVHMASRGDAMWLVVYGVSGLVLTALIAWLRAARRHAEAAGEQVSFLAEVSEVLASSLDYQATLSAAARLAVPRLADWCAVDIIDADGRLRRLAIAHADPAKVDAVWAMSHRYREQVPEDPVPQVIRTARHAAHPRDSRRAAPPLRAGRGSISRACGPSAFAPCSSCRSPPAVGSLGAITFVWPSRAGDSRPRRPAAGRGPGPPGGHRGGQRPALPRGRGGPAGEGRAAVALLDTVFRGTPVGLAFVDRELRFVRVNDALAALNRVPRRRAPRPHRGRRASATTARRWSCRCSRRCSGPARPVLDRRSSPSRAPRCRGPAHLPRQLLSRGPAAAAAPSGSAAW